MIRLYCGQAIRLSSCLWERVLYASNLQWIRLRVEVMLERRALLLLPLGFFLSG